MNILAELRIIKLAAGWRRLASIILPGCGRIVRDLRKALPRRMFEE